MNTDLNLDPNGDGVNHLMAYALELDPNADFISSPLEATLDSNSLGITFFAGKQDVTYTPQTSTDLKNWTSDGVTLSELTLEGRRTASVRTSQPIGFLRLHLALDDTIEASRRTSAWRSTADPHRVQMIHPTLNPCLASSARSRSAVPHA